MGGSPEGGAGRKQVPGGNHTAGETQHHIQKVTDCPPGA